MKWRIDDVVEYLVNGQFEIGMIVGLPEPASDDPRYAIRRKGWPGEIVDRVREEHIVE